MTSRLFFALLSLPALCPTAGARGESGTGMAAHQAAESPGAGAVFRKETVRDRLWVWAHEAGVYNGAWGLPGDSRITPVDGAHYLGVPNIIFIRYEGKPEPPFNQYAIPFRSLKRVNWSITGAGGATSAEERAEVLRLAASMPNLTGVFMDDFFHLAAAQAEASSSYPDRDARNILTDENKTGAAPDPGSLRVEQLREVRDQLRADGRRVDLGVTLYTHQLDPRVLPHLELCDVISLWTWQSENLTDLGKNLAKLEGMAPGKRIWLGCYMWDFGNRKPMPLKRMQRQCELGLKWLRESRIDGMIFLAANICDLDLETVEWTRQWIAEVGAEPLTARRDRDSAP